MGFIGSLLSSKKGAGFQADGTPIVSGTNAGQIGTAYDQAQGGLGQQQNLVNALSAQNGIQNQSNVFNQLQNVASGQGPNPAQAMLNQATGTNVANTAALMAGARGASANPGMIARQAGQVGANAMQQAAGQGATMQANQSLGALGQMSGVAGQQVGQQANAVNSFNQAAQNEQNQLLQAQNAANNANVTMQGNINNANASIAGINAKNQADIFSGIASNIGKGIMALSDGGEVPAMDGGPVSSAGRFLKGFSSAPITAMSASSVPGAPLPVAESSGYKAGAAMDQSAGKIIGAIGRGVGSLMSGAPGAVQGIAPMGANIAMPMMAGGGKVPAMLSPGEVYVPPNKVAAVAKGQESPSKAGRRIPGKAKVKGDSKANDTVPAKLEEGGVVIPRSVMQSNDAAGHAARFVAATLAKSGRMSR